MRVVKDGAEHDFLLFLEMIRANPQGWIACTFPFSKKTSHEELVSKKAFIPVALAKLQEEVNAFIDGVRETINDLPNAVLFKFADGDVILLCNPRTDADQQLVRNTLVEVTARFPKGFCDYGFLTQELGVFHKIADHKLLAVKKMQAYETLGHAPVTNSLALRRKRRDEPLVLIVEDDRFTASYIANFLKEYELVIARSGEEAVLAYLEHAPDAVFLDIHLPGMSGIQVLQCIKSADPDAFVVMLSVDTSHSSIVSASEGGAVSFLKKPFSRERLLNTLRLSPHIKASAGILPIHSGKKTHY
ncbi:MAG: response regulator [Micavibrio aeruginosavorus]|uniref:Response regulator n=1 Tax=Micavibrio aeruginosavorus TaxID=349221 RepID=A0A2W4ZRI1_9BACT|nr:MAG: response regulator [Micavibrio aeruginosavorus]